MEAWTTSPGYRTTSTEASRIDRTNYCRWCMHEAYLRLVGNAAYQWQSRAHFFGAAAESIRRILVENARKRARIKHGGCLCPFGDLRVGNRSTRGTGRTDCIGRSASQNWQNMTRKPRKWSSFVFSAVRRFGRPPKF